MQRGIRQGCPSSQFLYAVALSPLLHKLKSELHDAMGPSPPLKVLAYADDVCVLLHSEQDNQVMLQYVQKFEHASGSVLNKQKTQQLVVYNTGESLQTEFPTVPKIKILGIWFEPQYKTMIANNYNVLINKLQTLSYLCKYRSLSLLSRIKYVNIYLLSKVWYVANVLTMPRVHGKNTITVWLVYLVSAGIPCQLC